MFRFPRRIPEDWKIEYPMKFPSEEYKRGYEDALSRAIDDAYRDAAKIVLGQDAIIRALERQIRWMKAKREKTIRRRIGSGDMVEEKTIIIRPAHRTHRPEPGGQKKKRGHA